VISNKIGKPERPITSLDQDVLGREEFVRRISNAVLNPTTRQATGIVIGITGPWGSGKSSILNLLRAQLQKDYPEALIVSFDPWLISGRNDLISEFIAELLATMRTDSIVKKRFSKLVKVATTYGTHLAPIANLATVGLGGVVQGGLAAIKAFFARDESLASLRARMMSELEKVAIPIVVLIDELDRVDDAEIRAVSQLVRSVVDFPGISYVLAYDAKRVIQALGGVPGHNAVDERGRQYLEKIVQLQIPIPVTFASEIRAIIMSEVSAVRVEAGLPENFANNERYQSLLETLSGGIITTPRDVKRLIGTYHALAGMASGEVDWIDLLAYCALLVKAPETIERIRQDPEMYVVDSLSHTALTKQQAGIKLSINDRLAQLVPAGEAIGTIATLLGSLFPYFTERPSEKREPDRLAYRRPLLTTLRLGLLPGAYTRVQIEEMMKKPRSDISAMLQQARKDGTLPSLLDRFGDVYGIGNENHLEIWFGVADFLKKPDAKWMTEFSDMYNVERTFIELLVGTTERSDTMRSEVRDLFNVLIEQREMELAPHLLRSQIHAHGLFGNRQQNGKGFLSREDTQRAAEKLSESWRDMHLSGNLLPSIWSLQPVYTMIDTGKWDQQCRSVVDTLIQEDAALDSFTLMMYGAYYSTDKSTVEKICSYDNYVKRVNERVSKQGLRSEVHSSVMVALEKALRGGW
jgi:hypothetical protein